MIAAATSCNPASKNMPQSAIGIFDAVRILEAIPGMQRV
ncbi:hypothetical protein AMC99_00755 [Altererythrobacter epoxidivorans]|uniref:Uncharacterized protein n=1 Tax=Altererythrobacter epoxidivorans TaxID=361183 RepID=A0A0M4MSD8_9SPHN|nr:hypothetical protein AMC99_00755 [Altererythrobacter epoxidivorans]